MLNYFAGSGTAICPTDAAGSPVSSETGLTSSDKKGLEKAQRDILNPTEGFIEEIYDSDIQDSLILYSLARFGLP